MLFNQQRSALLSQHITSPGLPKLQNQRRNLQASSAMLVKRYVVPVTSRISNTAIMEVCDAVSSCYRKDMRRPILHFAFPAAELIAVPLWPSQRSFAAEPRVRVKWDLVNRPQATSFHLGQLKAKLAKLKRELLTPQGGGGGGGVGFDVARTGVASVGFIGFPSVGKSTLMSRLTGQHSEAAAYEFTTLTTVPGQVVYNGAKIQMLDLPGIIQGAKDGKGRGRQVIAVSKTCHLIFIVLDVNKPLTDKRVIENELEGFGIRINKEPPNIKLTKKDKGGISITSTVPLTHIDKDEIKAVMNEYRMANCDIAIRCDATIDDLIDVIEAKSRSYIPVIYALNKIDAISIEELDLLYRIPNACPISSEHGWNVDELMEQMWTKLELKRVYTKPKGRLPDYTAPVVLKKSSRTVEDFCNAIHKTIVEQFKIAIVYGRSVKHQPQRVGLSHELEDEDIITIIKK
nr:ribosome-interacting gtpase 1 [Quercus suber]